MSQQVPLDNNGGVPQGNDVVAPSYGPDQGYDPQNYAPQSYTAPNYGGSNVPAPYGGGDGGFLPPTHVPQNYARNRAPMIDPIESARLTPQILVLLVFSGLARHWKWSLPMGLILGLLAAGGLYLAFPLQYEARASIQIRAVRPQFLFDVKSQGRYDDFVQTQLALMKSPAVLDMALDDPLVSKLPIILKQKKDGRGWLRKRLSVRPDGKSEIVAISIETDSEEASERIVNAVVDCYFNFIDDVAKKTDNRMLVHLQSERRKQQQAASQLQDTIRTASRKAASQGAAAGSEGMVAGMGLGESLMRDVQIADAQLTAMKAELKAIQERILQPSQIPYSVLATINPELAILNGKIMELSQKREQYLQTVKPDDPRVVQLETQLKTLNDRLYNMTNNTGSPEMEQLQKSFRVQEEMNEYNAKLKIRTQEILVEELNRKYAEQLSQGAARAGEVVDVSFNQAQLKRTDKTLETIDDRILAIQSEQQAPGQISPLSKAVASPANITKQITVVGMGAAMFAVFPLLLSIVIERLKPRLYHVSQVRRSIPQVLIGEIMEPPVSWIHGTTFRKRLARYRESVHNWCTHLLLSDSFRSCRTLSIASVAGDDGKTFLAVQIAVAMAQMKANEVLLIDGDMRVGRLHLLFGNEEAGIGLADVLSGQHKFGEAVVMNEKEPNLHLLSAGQLDVTPYELLGDGRFREFLDMLEQRYSLIIVVLPPVANAAESLIMAQSTDSTLLCVRQGETVLAAMEDVYRKLVNTGTSVDGIVVKDIPYYQMAGRDGGFADKLEQIRLSHLLQYAE